MLPLLVQCVVATLGGQMYIHHGRSVGCHVKYKHRCECSIIVLLGAISKRVGKAGFSDCVDGAILRKIRMEDQ